MPGRRRATLALPAGACAAALRVTRRGVTGQSVTGRGVAGRGVTGLVVAGLVAGGLVAAAPALAATSCADTPGSDFYPGPSASAVYDETFAQGPAIPDLPTYTPQGLTTWRDWDGAGHDLLVLGTYLKGHRSRLYGIDPASGARVGSVYIAEAHAGGVAIAGSWLFVQSVQGNSNGAVRRYRLSDLRAKMSADRTPYLSAAGSQGVYSAEFMGSYGGYIWSGHYRSTGPDKMYQYKVGSDGKLSVVGSSWKVPPKTQGVLVTADRFVFSSSEGTTGAGKLRVTTKTHDYTTAAGRCFRSPSMSEGITSWDGKAYLAFEGASQLYASAARNPVANLHKASVATLSALTN